MNTCLWPVAYLSFGKLHPTASNNTNTISTTTTHANYQQFTAQHTYIHNSGHAKISSKHEHQVTADTNETHIELHFTLHC
jgi:hypothetical protein